MNKINNMISINKIQYYSGVKKVMVAVLLCAALALGAIWPVPTSAQSSTPTVAELQRLLNQVLAQLQALQGSTGNVANVCPYIWTRSLGQGSTGADVMRLQQFLNASSDTRLAIAGAGSPGRETQYYGPITANAVSRFQTKYTLEILTPLGLVGPTGYFGPSSRAKANQLCVSGGTTTPPPTNNGDGALHGGAGSISDVRLTSGIANEEVGEGQNNVDVLGLELQAEGSDIELSAVTVDFDQISHNENLDRYARSVSVWLDGQEYARVDADEFTHSNNERQTITLDRGAVIRQGDVGELVISIDGASTIDSTRVGDRWNVGVDSARFLDAQGAIVTDNQMNDLTRTITFREFASAAGLGVIIRSGDSDINQARTVEVSSSDRTSDVPVLSFKVEVEGDSDVLIDEMTFDATTTGGTLNQIATAAYLEMDNSRVGSRTITSAGDTITFDNLDLKLQGGKTYDFEVQMDLNAANNTNYASGATIDVDLTSNNRNDWYIEDDNGDSVSSTNRRGTALSDTHTLRTGGTSLSLVSVTTREVSNSSTPSASYGEFRMVVDVRAIGGPVYIPETAVRSNLASTAAGMTYRFENASGDTYTAGASTGSFSRVSGGTIENGFVRIDEGQTARFELVTTLDPATFDQYRAQIVSIGFNDTANAPDSTITTLPAVNYRTGLQVINN